MAAHHCEQLPIQGSRVQNHRMAIRSTEPFIFLRLIK